MLKKMASMLMCVPLLTTSTYKIPHKHFNITLAKKVEKSDFEKPSDKLIKLENDIKKGKQIIQTEMLNEMSIALKQQLDEKQRIEEEKAKYIEIDFILTFYTSLNCENGYGAVTCRGENLVEGIVASNYYPLGTIINLDKYGEVIVADRGSKNFNSNNRLDVYIPREYGESEYQYYKRVNKMGKQKVKGKILRSELN